jgi:hypothetical protein
MADYNSSATKVIAKAGPVDVAQGSEAQLRIDKKGALVTTPAHGTYQEAVLGGNVYTIQVKSATVTATTDISPLPASTGRGLLGIINPLGSGKNAVILKIGMSTVSGTPGGPFYIDVSASPSGATLAGTAPTNNLTLNASGSAMRGVAAAVPAQTAVAVMLRPLGGPAAVAAGAGPYQVDEFIDGSIVVPPGGMLVISAHATGTSHVVSGYMTWEEVAI